MKIIAHRGNLHGPRPQEENTPLSIDAALDAGYDAEIDVWACDGRWYLGHDAPVLRIPPEFFIRRRASLWIHCKNIEAASLLFSLSLDLNYFWHETDRIAITSHRYLWTHPMEHALPYWNQVVLDFSPHIDLSLYRQCGVYGVCVDYLPTT